MKITFVGGAQELTGSCVLVEGSRSRFLVDCGMVQGSAACAARNWQSLPFDPKQLDFIVLTRAEAEYSGLTPRLLREGFSGVIYAQEASTPMLNAVLTDCAKVLEDETDRISLRGANRLSAKAPYSANDVRSTLARIRHIRRDSLTQIGRVCFQFGANDSDAGSSSLRIWIAEPDRTIRLHVSGAPSVASTADLVGPVGADVLVLRASYGDRCIGPAEQGINALGGAAKRVLKSRGNLIIPASGGPAADAIVRHLHKLPQVASGDVSVFVDSAAANVLVAGFQGSPMRLYAIEDARSSEEIARTATGVIIVAGGGMCETGRVRTHLRYNLPRPESCVVLARWPAGGTLARRLLDKVGSVRMFREEVPVRAQILPLYSLSGGAGYDQIFSWATSWKDPPTRTFIVNAEPKTSAALGRRLQEKLGWDAVVPSNGQAFEIGV